MFWPLAPQSHKVDSLWTLVAPPATWALHFAFSYVAAAMVCARAPGDDEAFGALRLAIGAGTAVALALIALLAVHAWRRWDRHSHEGMPYDADTIETRRNFLGFAELLLCGLSALAVVMVAMPAFFIGSCR